MARKKIDFTKVRVEIVHWLDAVTKEGWHAPKKDYHPSETWSVGWVIQDDARGVTLVGSAGPDGKVAEATTIPLGMITKREVLREPNA